MVEGDNIRVPKTWEPRDGKVFQAMTTYDMKSDIQREMVRLRQKASSEMKWSEAPQNQYLKRLWKGLRQADQTVLRRAYQLLIREEQRRIRNERAHYEIRDFLQRNGGGYARPQRGRQKLKIPVELGGTTNRESWGEQMRDFYQALYTSSDPSEGERFFRLMIAVGKRARARDASKITFQPEQIRGILEHLPKDRASGIDGVPSNVFHCLTFRHHIWLAEAFTQLINEPWEPSQVRPPDWDHASVSLLAKKGNATQLTDYRPIALICQSQKIWERLLATEPQLHSAFGDFQYGFRRGRQCAEVVATLLRVKKLALQWGAGYVLFRVDVRNAFDTMKHSSVLSMLLRQGFSDRLTYAIGREVGKTYQHIKLGTVPSSQPTRMSQGLKQGSPLSHSVTQ